MFLVGGSGFCHEVFFVESPTERPFLVAACMALMGLPFVLSGDRVLRSKSPEEVAAAEAAKLAKRRAALQSELDRLGANGG